MVLQTYIIEYTLRDLLCIQRLKDTGTLNSMKNDTENWPQSGIFQNGRHIKANFFWEFFLIKI
jgi:hypothetical protein